MGAIGREECCDTADNVRQGGREGLEGIEMRGMSRKD